MTKKTFLFGTLIIIAISVFALDVSDSFAILAERTNLEKYQENEIILIGNVTSLVENTSEGFTEYEIEVEKFIKNSQISDKILAIGSGVQGHEILSINQIFNVQDRVFLFLNEHDGQYHISPYSFNALVFNPDEEFLLSPLTLYRAGISSDDIECRDSLKLILKASDNSPACVTSNTKAKLVERGWAL